MIDVKDIRDFLEGYNIDKTILSDAWLENRRDKFVIPYVEQITRQSFTGIKSTVEYHSGTGESTLMLDKKPIISLSEIRYVYGGDYVVILDLGMIEVIAAEGILKAKVNLMESSAIYPYFVKGDKNVKVTYKYGYDDYPADVKEAIIYLCAYQSLNFIAARTGGGSLGVQGFNRNYGDRGKYTDILKHLTQQAHTLLAPYSSGGVVGS